MPWFLPFIFIFQVIALYFISQYTIRLLFQFLRTIFKHDSIVFSIISIIFFPGTVIHELSHFLMATILLLKVREITILPKWDNSSIKLGSVIYEKKDVIRSIIVGIAPIIVGLVFFWWFSVINVIEIPGSSLKILAVYLIFVISSTMFSSRQDLIDIVYVVPFIIIVGIVMYLFPEIVSIIASQRIIVDAVQNFMYDVNIYLFISISIHLIFILMLRILLSLNKT